MEKNNAASFYQLINHTADCGIEVVGDDLTALFENAGRALYDLISDTADITPTAEYSLEVSGMDMEDLMVSWLRALLDFWTCQDMLVSEITVMDLSGFRLAARIRGDSYRPETHSLRHEIKAVTYHRIQVAQAPDGRWRAVVIFDM